MVAWGAKPRSTSSKFKFRRFQGGSRAARRVKFPRRIDRGEVLEAGISGRSVTYPVRLRSSVSWAIQVFRPDCFGSGCGIFSW